ncbi:MAG TPA: hypothetical protein VIF60_10280 [Burkholderiaceae bacterium]
MKFFLLAVLVFFAFPAEAQWAALAIVGSKNAVAMNISVERKSANNSGDCSLRLDIPASPQKRAWMVVAKRNLDRREQDMEPYFWHLFPRWPDEAALAKMTYPVTAPIVSVRYWAPKSSYNKEDRKSENPYAHCQELNDCFHTIYELTVPDIAPKNVYLFIDGASPMVDQGWRYSIDIGSLCS